jgi:hypothetical protein
VEYVVVELMPSISDFQIPVGKPVNKRHLGDLGIDGSMILKRILK